MVLFAYVPTTCWAYLLMISFCFHGERHVTERRGRAGKANAAEQIHCKNKQKTRNAICGGHSLFCGAPTLLSHWEGNTVVCMATIHLPVCLYALLTTCGDAPDGLQMVSRDLLPDLHRYITSHRGSTGLRSVEPEGTNAFIIEELFHTGHMRLAIVLPQDEPRAEC